MPAEIAKDVATDFCYIANAMYGLYLDTAMAIGNLAKSYMDYHTRLLKELTASAAPQPPEAVNPQVVYTAQSGGESKPVHDLPPFSWTRG